MTDKRSGATAGGRDGDPEAIAEQAVAAVRAGDPQTAEAVARAGLAKAAPRDRAWMTFTLGWVLQVSDRLDEAITAYRQAIELDPDYASAYQNLGNSLQRLGRAEEALPAYRRVLEIEPDHPRARRGLACAQRATGDLEPAIAAFRELLAREPEDRAMRIELALALLLAGDLEAAWPYYEAREPPLPEAAPGCPDWNGEDLEGRTILLRAEQGLGDTIQFVRYAPLVEARGGRVLLQIQPALARLCRTAPGMAEVIRYGDALPDCERQARLMSLPLRFGTTLESIPDRVPYLAAEPERIAHWRDRLAGRPGLKVGLAWQGKPNRALDRGRSLPLAELIPLGRVPGVRLISLQKHHGREQIAALPADVAIEDYGAEMDEGPDAFVDTAAIMESLDLVVTSDTAIPHLAGALGRPVWLLTRRLPEWRWLLGREDSPWYPTMRLFRQAREGEWAAPVERIGRALARLAQGDARVLHPEPWHGAPLRSLSNLKYRG